MHDLLHVSPTRCAVVVFLSSTFSYFQEAKSNAIMQVCWVVLLSVRGGRGSTSTSANMHDLPTSPPLQQGFKNLVPKKCKVLRDGAMAVLDASELVPGDVVEYQEGDQVPADLRVTFAYNLKVSS
jgi:sodium/potassium-transporting ATPase subunit alpha